jgi:CRP-like cAMP-binding protein
MLTPVERVLILKSADLLKDVGPRHLLGLADVAQEIEISKGEILYGEDDPADALYMVVEGRVRLSTGDRTTSEVGPGEAFGTWALVDDSRRGHRAECTEGGLALALQREDFYDRAAGDLDLLKEVVRVLAKRLRSLVTDRPEEARVEGEGIEQPEAQVEAEAVAADTAGAALEAAALGQPPATESAPGENPPEK